jgi:hypothetical protein
MAIKLKPLLGVLAGVGNAMATGAWARPKRSAYGPQAVKSGINPHRYTPHPGSNDQSRPRRVVNESSRHGVPRRALQMLRNARERLTYVTATRNGHVQQRKAYGCFDLPM